MQDYHASCVNASQSPTTPSNCSQQLKSSSPSRKSSTQVEKWGMFDLDHSSRTFRLEMTRWLSEMTGWGPYNGLKIWGNSDEYAPFSSDMGSAGPYFRCKRCLCWQYTDFRSNIFGIFVTISVILITGPNKWYGEASKYCSYTFCNVTLGGSCPHDPIGPPSMKDKVRTSNRYGWSLKSQVSSLKSEVGHQVRLVWLASQ